jgi:hypothetical protein
MNVIHTKLGLGAPILTAKRSFVLFALILIHWTMGKIRVSTCCTVVSTVQKNRSVSFVLGDWKWDCTLGLNLYTVLPLFSAFPLIRCLLNDAVIESHFILSSDRR